MEILSIEQAVKKLTNAVYPVSGTEKIPLEAAICRVLAEDIQAERDQPPFDRSPLDGYALIAEDTKGASKDHPISLKVVDKIMAGFVADHGVTKGTAVRLMTGAPIPEGANCVIRQENTDYGEDTVQIYEELNDHDNICDIGEDYQKGTLLLEKGRTLSAATIGLAASAGKKELLVYKLPNIAVFSTGDELIAPGQIWNPGKIYDSNLYYTVSRLAELGSPAILFEQAADDPAEMEERIKEAAKTAELIITTGGVSVGEKDIMHEVVERLEAEQLFWRVSVKPGAPTLAFKYQNTLIISLTGNPYGVAVNFELLVRPVLERFSHGAVSLPVRCSCILQNAFAKASPGRRMVRAKYDNDAVTIPDGSHVSGAISSMADCNCFIDIPAGNQGLQAGDAVEVILFRL